MVKYLEDRSGSNQRQLNSKIPQKELQNSVQFQLGRYLFILLAIHISFLSLETDLKLLPDLCQLLESVCTARDFLLEIGGKPEKSLVEFMVILYVVNVLLVR